MKGENVHCILPILRQKSFILNLNIFLIFFHVFHGHFFFFLNMTYLFKNDLYGVQKLTSKFRCCFLQSSKIRRYITNTFNHNNVAAQS